MQKLGGRMKSLIKYTLGPLWLVIGISYLIEGSWSGGFALAAGILFCIDGYLYYRNRGKSDEVRS